MTNFINSILKFIKENGPIFSLLTFFIGLLVGNYFNIWRDRRKEWNSIIEPIRNRLIKFNGKATHIDIKQHDIIDIRSGLPFWKRRGFDKAIEKCNKSTSQDNIKNGAHGFEYIDHQKNIHANEKLLIYLKKK